MRRSRVIQCGALALLVTIGAPLGAQAAPRIELAFGYECGDRFLVKNDGTQPVLVEYAPAGSQDRSQLHLSGKQTAEVAMAQDGNLDLFVGGKLVASAAKGNRPCAAVGTPPAGNAPPGDSAAVRPSDQPPDHPPAKPQAPDSTAKGDSSTTVPNVFVYAPPSDIVLYPRDVFANSWVHGPHPSAGPVGSAGYAGSSIGRSVSSGKGSGRAHR